MNIQEQIEQNIINSVQQQLSEMLDMIKNKTILVAGGAGFIGPWFCKVAIACGAKVICVDNLIASQKSNLNGLEASENFTFINDAIEVAELPDGCDYVVNMASIASPPLYQRFPKRTLASGYEGSKRLLEFCETYKCRYLFTSTSEVYGDPLDEEIPTSESCLSRVQPYGVRSCYDISKMAGETLCYIYKDDVDVRIARIFNTYGPGIDTKSTSQYGRALIKFVTQAITGKPITVYGTGEKTRSFCYITDQLVGLYKLLLTDTIDEPVNIGNDREITILELAQIIKSVANSESIIELNAIPSYNLNHDPKRRCPQLTRAQSLLNFHPQVTLEDGLGETIAWTRVLLSSELSLV